MNNFPVIIDGKERWISRSVAVAVSIYTFVDGKLCILANKRGTGLPGQNFSNPGKWNVVSGFIDYDETLKEACIREVHEETGVDISNVELKLMLIDDSPKRSGQVILFRYIGFYYNPKNKITLTNKYSEPKEVDDVKFIPINELDNYDWTSENHKEKIKEYGNYILYNNSTARAIAVNIARMNINLEYNDKIKNSVYYDTDIIK